MTEQEKFWLEKLIKDREESARTLEKPSMRGIKNSVVEKYSDQAHFIYELLQNANDAKATKSSFHLTKSGLYFKHNGSIGFSVSNPDTEEWDKKNNKLGHLNSITSIANSNKTESTIGKFGVGFKAVFQYTDTPHIYNLSYKFKIERFIVPKLLNGDLPDRKTNETVFYFPFDKKEVSEDKAYSDILDKLNNLIHPTLFLTELQEIEWKSGNISGKYSKRINSTKHIEDIVFQEIDLNQWVNNQLSKDRILLFSQHNNDLYYSVGYFIKNNKLIPKSLSAFCYFPTKETTNLNIVVHAPFLLNDSRESIKRTEKHNNSMVELLANLTADSLRILRDLNLIDDDIIKIIPYKKSDFYEEDRMHPLGINKPKLFAPIFDSIKDKFSNEELLPASSVYVSKKNAYWAQDSPILGIFSDEQLSLLLKNNNAKWVFRNIARNQTGKDEELREYIDNCILKCYDISQLFKFIDEHFIQNQTIEWLNKLYEYLSRNNSYWNDVKTKPIFLNKNRKAVAAFERKGNDLYAVLFLPSDNANNSINTILPEFLVNLKSREFIETFGIKKPSLKDEIYNSILPLYAKNGEIDTDRHFQIFFNYWKNEGRPEDFLDLLKDKEFISFKSNDNDNTYRGLPSEIYYPSNEIKQYFQSKSDTQFVDLEDYYTFINDDEDRVLLKEFLFKLGVAELPRIYEREVTDENDKNRIRALDGTVLERGSYGYHNQGTFDKVIDGCKEIIKSITYEKSIYLWNMLCKLDISNITCIHKYFYYSQHQQFFESTSISLLKNEKWLFLNDNAIVSPHDISIDELPKEYERNAQLESILGFKSRIVLSIAERIALKFESEEDAELAKKLLEEHKAKIKLLSFPNFEQTKKVILPEEEDKINKARIERTIKDLSELQGQIIDNTKRTTNEKPVIDSQVDMALDDDVEFKKRVEALKEQLEIKRNRIDLFETINNSVKYSYEWFLSYLKLLTTYSEKQGASSQKTITFQDIKPFKTDNKYFLLCGADGYVSPEIENADDFKISLFFGSGKKENIEVEGVSKKGQDLLIYCREPLSSNTLSRLRNIFKIEINFTPAIDLLDRLYKAFTNNLYVQKWTDIMVAIPPLHYIYGPPGTGKTTQLCKQIIELLSLNSNSKILVLTPTNKAADVVCKKIIEIDLAIQNIRLSRPTDPELEEYGIYRASLSTNDMKSIQVVSSTIHRLPYFDIRDSGLIFKYDWDYVIFDESSMIGLHYITFALLSLSMTSSKTKFIIAGDPKQIPPVIEINDTELENLEFQDENIYKMMNLESFIPEEQQVRTIDRIDNLTTQYRSIPRIGQLFSELAYSGLLRHSRAVKHTATKPLPTLFTKLISSNVTFINIPLNQDNSIYKVSKLFYSSYHMYCAILVTEIIKYFDQVNLDDNWTIGLIAPYKAQAVLLNKLITSYSISEKVKVYSDTVHGFQGDECDIVFFICNPNSYIYTGHHKALLSKEYIYNVAISRAKDYLVILHPFVIQNPYIYNIGVSYRNHFGNQSILAAHDLEEVIFNNPNYIENNSYVSGHDNVNVFGHTDMKYFIKANDTAIDFQLKNLKENKSQPEERIQVKLEVL